jgi:sulfite oxidase
MEIVGKGLKMISRRDFLKGVSAAVVASGAAIPPLLTWATDDSSLELPGEEGMIVRSARFLDLEAPPEFLTSWITPVPHFFVRNHMHEPSTLDPDSWRLTVAGEVEKPLTLRLLDLSKLEHHAVTNTLECAGNGRGFQQPNVPGIQWQKGAVGTARFSGPRLRDLLQRAGVKSTGKHVMFRGLDEVPGKVPPFIRSIPIEKATDAALTRHHGFPARALVPGWIGAASCKWISEIKVLDKEFDGNFMKPGYRFPDHPGKPGDPMNPDETHVITALGVKSVIAAPADGATVKSRSVYIQGVAWAGEAEVVRVEISTDAGATWKPAQLGREQSKYAWRLWTYIWKAPKAGDYTVMARAADTKNRTQPETAVWNPSGYLYNAIDQVKILVQA